MNFKDLKKEIDDNIKERNTLHKKSVLADIDKIIESIKNKHGVFKKFVFVGESPYNDGEDSLHRIYYSCGYVKVIKNKDKSVELDYDSNLENYAILNNIFDDSKNFDDIYDLEYLFQEDNTIIENYSFSHIKEKSIKQEAELIDKLLRTIQPTNFLLIAEYSEDIDGYIININYEYHSDY